MNKKPQIILTLTQVGEKLFLFESLLSTEHSRKSREHQSESMEGMITLRVNSLALQETSSFPKALKQNQLQTNPVNPVKNKKHTELYIKTSFVLCKKAFSLYKQNQTAVQKITL